MAAELKDKQTAVNGDAEKTSVNIEETNETPVNGNSHYDHDKDVELEKKKATQLLLQGKRNILIRDYQGAVAALAESCQMFTKIYDEKADEMGDPYFYYGKALFELARNESEVLGDQMQEDENNDEDEDEDDDDGQVDSAVEKNSEVQMAGGTNEQVDDMSDETLKEGPSDEKNHEDENEDVNDLQLSWEYLELAKMIYLRNANKCKSTAIKLSEVYLVLGENGLESENYEVAIEDMQQALALQQKVLPEEDRRIAETFYHLGVAHSLKKNFDEAASFFESAIKQLEKKITSLEARQKSGDTKTEDEEKDAFYTMSGEIEDIRSVIKDIREKITDMLDYKNQMKAKLIEEVVSGGQGAGTSASNSASPNNSSSSSVPVTDISHLVRKKRKNESEENENCKKAKPDNDI